MYTMQLIATNVARSMVCLSVFVTQMCRAKTAKPLEMPFGGEGLTILDLKNHVLDGIKIGRIYSQP